MVAFKNILHRQPLCIAKNVSRDGSSFPRLSRLSKFIGFNSKRAGVLRDGSTFPRLSRPSKFIGSNSKRLGVLRDGF